jgi:hypothetical protein
MVTEPLNAAVGVPLIVPDDEPIASGPGSPVADQVYGGTPPVAAMVWL